MVSKLDAALQAVSYPCPTDRKRRKLRVAIVTENFLPKIDGVTRTLARLLEHLHAEGNEALVLGPDTGLSEYSGHSVVGTFGFPLLVYPGLKLNFMRPRFVRRLLQFRPDVIHFVDPVWLGVQMMWVVKRILPDVPCVSSYHTNLPTYASLFGIPFIENILWNMIRAQHNQCDIVFCPSETTRRMLREKGFNNVEIWSRGVDTKTFNPAARDENLRESWDCKPKSQALIDTLCKQNNIPTSNDSETFIHTPDSLPILSPHLSPPPAYESLSDLPPIFSQFSLPPPVVTQVDVDAASHDANSKAVILYVGRISWEKNIRLLIEAFRMLPSNVRDNAKLVLVGDGPARGELTRLCARYKLDAVFMGHQKGKRLASMFASSSIFAFPSFTETFGQVVLEALASGLPVVGLHAEGTSDLVCHGITGLLLDVRRILELNSSSARSATVAARQFTLDGPCKDEISASNILSHKDSDTTPFKSSLNYSSAGATLTPGLPTPILSIKECAAAMASNSASFQSCAQAYSMLLERLIRDRTLRATMGQRAQQYASTKTWWDAMDAPVRGYERVVEQKGKANLTDFELEALRNDQRRKLPLTGSLVQTFVALYLVFFVILWIRLL
ncbi:hypothetical protein MPSI1_001289 [Malassezia psittaci]|uniref:UDP-Glycosyltransferase/glycogen phosphorylase n=1 Tax=Malassezia psittaci TaxID=1821823 RepID=A0AAF0JD63_9BASI|nr:hypothetical protein MPSI1_001289 [Malassezia psittaci]